MSAVVSHAGIAAWLRRPSSGGQAAASPINGVDAARLVIHRNNYVSSLLEALTEAFPVTRALSGDAFFRGMARHRIFADPPRSPVVGDYARDFPQFVANHPAASALPFLASVAQLEVLCLQAYHGADAMPLPGAAFQSLVADPARCNRTGLRLHPSARWLRSRFAIHRLWTAHQGLDDMRAADLAGLDPCQPESVLVARPGLDVVVVLLPPGAIAFLDALSAGHDLARAMDDARRADPLADPITLFSLLLRHGLAIELIDTPQELA